MQKGILAVILAGVLSVLMALPAAAVTVDFHGKAIMGGFGSSDSRMLGDESDENDRDSAFVAAGKVRFRAEVGTDDGRAKMVYGFETGGNTFGGDDWDYSGDSTDFENRFAYIQSVLPGLRDNIYARAGLQPTSVNEWVWTETAAGLTIHGKGRVNWMAGWFRGAENGFLDDDDEKSIEDSDLFVIKGDFSPAPRLTVGGFGVYAMDFGGRKDRDWIGDNNLVDGPAIESGSDQYWLGINGAFDGKVFASGDLIYQGGDAAQVEGGELIKEGADVSAYLANATVGVHVNNRSKVSFNALYVSGDDDDDDDDQEAFQSIDADVKVGQIFFKDSLAASADLYMNDQFGEYEYGAMRNRGLINLALEGEIQLDAKNNLRGAVRYLATAEDDPDSDESDLGYEFDLWYAYKMNKNLTLQLEGAYLVSGDLTEEMMGEDNNIYQFGAGAVFSF